MVTEESFKKMIELLVDRGGSDLHISPNNPIAFRINGLIEKDSTIITKEDTHIILEILLNEYKDKGDDESSISRLVYGKLQEFGNAGFSIEKSNYRFRVNVSKVDGGYYIVLREIKSEPPPLESLGFYQKTIDGLKFIASRQQGLFLVVGSTGSGKSTTLASLVRYINQNYAKNIITLEDPIEYVHKAIKSQIIQKELGRDFPRFSNGLHSALREDPDVILIGEIRDESSLELCLKASETGHLVLGTLHTNDAVSTVQRLVAMSENPKLARDRLSQSFLGAIAQKLAPRKDNKGRIIVYEMLISNKAISSLIKEGKDEQIFSQLDTTNYSNSFNKNIQDRFREGLIDRDIAIELSPNPKYLNLDGEGDSAELDIEDNKLISNLDTKFGKRGIVID